MIEDSTVLAMELYGGSFVKALAKCFRLADAENLRRLEASFGDVLGKYADLARVKPVRTVAFPREIGDGVVADDWGDM